MVAGDVCECVGCTSELSLPTVAAAARMVVHAAVTIIVLWVEQVIIVPACQADLDFLLHLECRQAAHAVMQYG